MDRLQRLPRRQTDLYSPLAAPCHDSVFGPYNEAECNRVRDHWFHAETHVDSPNSPMAPFFSNNSCNPFSARDEPCVFGTDVSYAVDARDAADYKATLDFTRRHNLRLVIRNSGHDYLGRSTGAGALGLWTRNIKDIEMFPEYRSRGYDGPAMKLGAGVSIIEAFEAADANGVVVVGGNCPTVGMAGGHTQGGGLGQLSSLFGLAVDQVLEWEVVTADGKELTASPQKNEDLFWALNGGGGGTYAAVLSMTIKAHADVEMSAAQLTFAKPDDKPDAFYDVLTTFHDSLPSIVDARATVTFAITPNAFMMVPAAAPGLSTAHLDAWIQPTLDHLDAARIPYQYRSLHFPTFLTYFNAMSYGANVSDYQVSGRLIPRSLVSSGRTADIVAAIRSIAAHPDSLMYGIASNVSAHDPTRARVSVNPAWRDTLFSAVLGTPFHYDDWARNVADQKRATGELVAALAGLTTDSSGADEGGAAYMNEADVNEREWQRMFFGEHYGRLDRIKRRYDPDCVFWGMKGVGSERWAQRDDGRLCKA